MPLNPFSMFVRIAKVLRVSTHSIEADFIFIDGEEDDTTIYRGEVIFGTANPGEDYIPSAAIVGKGDRVAVIVHAGPRYFITTKLDRFEYNNSNRTASYPFDIINKCLSGLCLGCEYNSGAYSYADFYIPEEIIIDEETLEEIIIPERIVRLENNNPDPDLNRISDRLFYYLSTHGQNNISFANVDTPTWPWEKLGGGPMTSAPININGIVKQGRLINHLPYVVDIPFSDTNFVGNLSAYSSTLTSLDKASVHPEVGDTLGRIQYDHFTVINFDDPDPEWVVIIAVYPAWSTAPYIKILEVPIYGWSERARNDDEDTELVINDLDLVNYITNDKVRELETITRSWIDWNLFGSNDLYSETLNRCPVFTAKRLEADLWAFCITDGYPYHNDPNVYSVNEIKRLYGSVKRVLATEPTTNGSPYDYEINHDNPNDASTNIQTYYYLDYHYWDDAAGDEGTTWYPNYTVDDQISIVYTDGINELTKKVDFDCDLTGVFTDNPVRSGRVKWG
jgi:hypothetical protein